jgi:hypothetical protein
MKGVKGGSIKYGQVEVAESRKIGFYKTKIRRERYISIHGKGRKGEGRRGKTRG